MVGPYQKYTEFEIIDVLSSIHSVNNHRHPQTQKSQWNSSKSIAVRRLFVRALSIVGAKLLDASEVVHHGEQEAHLLWRQLRFRQNLVDVLPRPKEKEKNLSQRGEEDQR